MENLPPEKKKAVEAVAEEAVKMIQSGMVVGVGTGRAATCFIEALLQRKQTDNLNIVCIATSLKSKKMIEGKINLIDESLTDHVDITFDGADRADPKTFALIKGGGGALLREKLVATRSSKNIMLIDETKLSSPLFDFPLPVEIVKFGHESTIERIKKRNFKGSLRKDEKTGQIVESDNGNYIFDIKLATPIVEPQATHEILKQTLGVIETGLFIDTATQILVGKLDGSVEILERP